MCRVCLALSGLYIAGEVSAGAATTFHQVVAQATRSSRIDLFR